jgi:hypothetical protein
VLRPSPAIEVEALRDDDRAADREDLARAHHAVPGVEPCVVLEDVTGGHAEAQQLAAHRADLVVAGAAVIARDEHLRDAPVAVQRGGGAHAVVEHRARSAVGLDLGAEHERRLRRRRGGRVTRPATAAEGHDGVGGTDDDDGAGDQAQRHADQTSPHHADGIRCPGRASCAQILS